MEVIQVDDRLIQVHIVPMKKDGSCLFHALSYFLFGTPNRDLEVRWLVVTYVDDNWDEWSFMTTDSLGNNYPNANAYSIAMCKQGTYGSTCEVKATSALQPSYRFEIFMHRKMVAFFGSGPNICRLRYDPAISHYDTYHTVGDEVVLPAFDEAVSRDQRSHLKRARRGKLFLDCNVVVPKKKIIVETPSSPAAKTVALSPSLPTPQSPLPAKKAEGGLKNEK